MTGLSITLLAGGVGGAKAAEGLAKSHYADSTKIIGNIADDDEFHGLWVSPDIDTLIYSLGDQIDRQQGWGRKHETASSLERAKGLGARHLDDLRRLGFSHAYLSYQSEASRC